MTARMACHPNFNSDTAAVNTFLKLIERDHTELIIPAIRFLIQSLVTFDIDHICSKYCGLLDSNRLQDAYQQLDVFRQFRKDEFEKVFVEQNLQHNRYNVPRLRFLPAMK